MDTVRFITLFCGGGATTPNPRAGQPLSQVIASNWFTPDIEGAVTMGSGTTYSVYPSTTPIPTAFTYAGEKIRLYVTSSGSYNTLVTGTVLVDAVRDTDLDFDVTTRIADIIPDAFTFASVTGVEPNTLTNSTDTWTISGIDDGQSSPISVDGPEQVTNGAFDTDTGWNEGTGWTIASGVATCDGTSESAVDMTQPGILTVGETITVTYTIVSISTGTVQCRPGGSTGIVRDTAGTYTEILTPSSHDILSFRGASNCDAVIDNISVRATGYTIKYTKNAGTASAVTDTVVNTDEIGASLVSGEYGETVTQNVYVGGVEASFSVTTKEEPVTYLVDGVDFLVDGSDYLVDGV